MRSSEAVARMSEDRPPTSPSTPRSGRARRYVMIGTDLEDYRLVRQRLGKGFFAEEVTINDVILATIAGAFRSWLLTLPGSRCTRAPRSERWFPSRSTRRGRADGAQVTACFVDLP